MADESTSGGTPAPEAKPAPAPAAAPAPAPAPAPVAAAPAAPPAPAASVEDDSKHPWLSGRLERNAKAEREKLLAELGVSSVNDLKSAVDAAKAAADAKKTAEERAAEYQQQLNATKSAAEKSAALLKETVGRMLMALTPEHQKAVTEFAGDDPEKQFLAIKHFAPTWAEAERVKDAAAKAAAEAASKVEPAKPVSSTSPAPGAPSGETPASPADPKSVYATTRTANPFKAAAYGLAHPDVYQKQ